MEGANGGAGPSSTQAEPEPSKSVGDATKNEFGEEVEENTVVDDMKKERNNDEVSSVETAASFFRPDSQQATLAAANGLGEPVNDTETRLDTRRY